MFETNGNLTEEPVMIRMLILSTAIFVCGLTVSAGAAEAECASNVTPVNTMTAYRTIEVDGINVFYREARPKGAPALLPLHDFPSSSRVFDTLMPQLADCYHLVAPAAS